MKVGTWFRPNVENLERRELMAAAVTASLTNGVLNITGTEGNDTIIVRQINNKISIDGVKIKGSGTINEIRVKALGGNDSVRLDANGLSSQAVRVKSIVWGGDGNDLLVGGKGSDELQGNKGNDKIYGMEGNDLLFGHQHSDTIYGGSGNDELQGGSGNDSLYGETGNDLLWGGTENDYLSGASGNDVLRGEEGRDTLWCGTGNADKVYANLNEDYLGDMVTKRWNFDLSYKTWWPLETNWVDINIYVPSGTHTVRSQIVSYTNKNASEPGRLNNGDHVNVYTVINGTGYSKGSIDISYIRNGIQVIQT